MWTHDISATDLTDSSVGGKDNNGSQTGLKSPVVLIQKQQQQQEIS